MSTEEEKPKRIPPVCGQTQTYTTCGKTVVTAAYLANSCYFVRHPRQCCMCSMSEVRVDYSQTIPESRRKPRETYEKGSLCIGPLPPLVFLLPRVSIAPINMPPVLHLTRSSRNVCSSAQSTASFASKYGHLLVS